MDDLERVGIILSLRAAKAIGGSASTGRKMSHIRSNTGASRREFLQAGFAVAGASLASAAPLSAASSASASQPAAAKGPNIIFFYTEAQRWDALGLAGNILLKTPNMDRIGREGVVFNKSFCTNALCAPSRAVALTGMYSHSTGALDNEALEALPASIPLFTDLLHHAGYETALCGKAHGPNGFKERPWDYYFAFNAPSTDYYNPTFHERFAGERGETRNYPGDYADDLATDRALNWLDQKRDKPFCLLLWHQSPHAPFYRPRKYLDLYNGVLIPTPETFWDYPTRFPGKPKAFIDAKNKIGTMQTGDGVRSLEELVKDYNAGFAGVDDNIGRVLDWLERSGEMDNTVIVLTSDHGYFLGEWQAYDKRFMHEPSIHTPMMIRYPKAFQPGTRREEMVLNLDVAPTLLELAGVEVPAQMQGRSVVEMAQGKAPDWRRDWLYEYFEYPLNEYVQPHRGVRTDRYKFIHYYLEPQEFEMYDLQEDPQELKNLYGDPRYADIQRHLIQRLAELRRETGDNSNVRVLDS